MIWLLDLNHTLVANSRDFDFRFPDLARERYRTWLVDELVSDGGQVILITWRHRSYEAATLAAIAEQTDGWQPTASFFNPSRQPAHVWKQKALRERIFGEFSPDPADYFGLESNENTRAAYAAMGIRACRVPPTPATLAAITSSP